MTAATSSATANHPECLNHQTDTDRRKEQGENEGKETTHGNRPRPTATP